MIFGSLRKYSGDLRISSKGFVLVFDNHRKVNSLILLAETNCPISSQTRQFLRSHNTGSIDCYIIKILNIVLQ